MAVVRLFRAGPSSHAVRSRSRLLAVSSAHLNISLLLAVWPQVPTGIGVNVVAVVAAVLVVVVFAAPDWLRRFWRPETTDLYADVQRSMIGARTPEEGSAEALPRGAELLGGDVARLEPGGAVVAAHGPADDQRHRLGRDRRIGQLGDDHHVVQTGDLRFVVRLSPDAPLLGRDDRQLAEGLALRLRAALVRVELYQAERQAGPLPRREDGHRP